MRIARAALHFWEEPPLSGSTGSGAVFFSHCPLQCVYCQNTHIAHEGFGDEVSPSQLAEICLRLQGQGALNINFVTPTHYTYQVIEAVRKARPLGLELPIVWNTSGYETVQTIESLRGTVDVFLADFKYADAETARRYSKAPDYPNVALQAIESMIECAGPVRFDHHEGQERMRGGVIVRHLLLPGSLDGSKQAVKLLFETFGDDVVYSIMNQYTPVIEEERAKHYPELLRPVQPGDYEQLLDFADSIGLDDYYWQDGPADASSFIPQWNGEGVTL